MKPIITIELLKQTYKQRKPHLTTAKIYLPLFPSVDLARITASLLTDGHIEWYKSDENPRPKKILFYSNKKKNCVWFLDLIENLFGIVGKIERYKSETGYSRKHSYKAIVYNALLARILILCGIPAGDKTKQSYFVPNWIMNGDAKIKASFLRILYNFDGSVPNFKSDRKCSIAISYSMNKEKTFLNNGMSFLQQIKQLLKAFDIDCCAIHSRLCKGNKFTLILSMTNQKSIINFYNHVGYMDLQKNKKLKWAISKIYRMGRIKLDITKNLLQDIKNIFGTDSHTIEEINKLTKKIYTKRQFRHMRRGETKIPIEMIDAALKIKKDEKTLNDLPFYVKSVLVNKC